MVSESDNFFLSLPTCQIKCLFVSLALDSRLKRPLIIPIQQDDWKQATGGLSRIAVVPQPFSSLEVRSGKTGSVFP
jgi:hypothetical protein